MKTISITSYIWLGLQWRYLQDAEMGRRIHGENLILGNIKRVMASLEKFGLLITLRAAGEIEDLEKELASTAVDSVLTTDQANKLKESLKYLQKTLEAEAGGKLAYIVTDKRVDIDKLLRNPSALFAPGVFESLPEIARFDFTEACLCIAFERSTASAFHTLRGTEGVLREFYSRLVKRNRVDPLLWGSITGDLRKRKKSPPAELLNNLDNIRLSFRNPTQHPEKIYDIQEIQDLLSLCIDVVNRMMKHGAMISS